MPPWSLQNSKNWVIFSHVEKTVQKIKKNKNPAHSPMNSSIHTIMHLSFHPVSKAKASEWTQISTYLDGLLIPEPLSFNRMQITHSIRFCDGAKTRVIKRLRALVFNILRYWAQIYEFVFVLKFKKENCIAEQNSKKGHRLSLRYDLGNLGALTKA